MANPYQASRAERLQDLLLQSPGLAEFLLELNTVSASLFPTDLPVCAITVERNGASTTTASSSEMAQRLNEQQYAFDGPSLTALRGRHTVNVPDLVVSGRWPSYAQIAADAGIRSLLAVPIEADAASKAVLNCYSPRFNAFDPGVVSTVEEHAAGLSGILRLALRLFKPDFRPGELRHVLEQRAVVDAGVALVMAQRHCSHERAMTTLQTEARRGSKDVQTTARNLLIAGGMLPKSSRRVED